VEHCPAILVGCNQLVAGFQVDAVALWQVRQLEDVGKCDAFLPGADVPSWQVEQVVAAVYAAWFGLAPNQEVVL